MSQQRPYICMPHMIANTSFAIYIITLLLIYFVFHNAAMQWYWWIFGIVSVSLFFYGSNYFTKDWSSLSSSVFKKQLFGLAFFLRLCTMLFLYWFFTKQTGRPFMFAAADSIGYHNEASWMVDCIHEKHFNSYLQYLSAKGGVSDAGYPMYLGFIYLLSRKSIIFARFLKTIWSSLSCVLIYKLARRNFGENIGRIAAIFCMLEPHLILYCGMHLKETEMLFLMIAFLERADALMRSSQFSIKRLVLPILLLCSLFCFRTVLGLACTFAIAIALIFSSKRIMNLGKKWILLIIFVLSAGYFVGGRALSEVEYYWEQRNTGQDLRKSEIVHINTLAQYAGKAIFAPMIFTIPFPTMVETTGQETSRMLHGGAVVKNIMSFFCILGILILLFNQSPYGWRNNVLLGAYLIAYLIILTVSAFAHADRFHMPALPIELTFAAFGLYMLNSKPIFKRFLNIWYILMVIGWLSWAWVKLKGRGLI